MSAPYVVVAGYRSKGERQEKHIDILTLAGDRIRVASESIIHSAKAEAGGSAEIFYIERDSEIQLTVPAVVIPSDRDSTTLKYYDDGGTIRKSYDDTMSSQQI
jgi:hypothetical protein